MYNNDQKIINPIAIVFIFFQLTLAIIIAAILNNAISDDEINYADYDQQPQVVIENLSNKVPELLPGDITEIQRELLRTIQMNIPDIRADKAKAVIRNNIINHQFDNQDFNLLNINVDLPQLEQSYRIFYRYEKNRKEWYPDPHKFLIVICPRTFSDIGYPDFKCHDEYDQKIEHGIVAEFINYLNPYFDYFSVYIESSEIDKIIINPSVTYDNDETTKSRYIKEVKDAIESLGISPDIFKYYVRTLEDVNYYN